jgi:hypothetical protein
MVFSYCSEFYGRFVFKNNEGKIAQLKKIRVKSPFEFKIGNFFELFYMILLKQEKKVGQ